MTTLNTVQETITVHGVNSSENVKYKNGGGVLIDPNPVKPLWINTVPKFNMSKFQKGNTYLVEREVSEAGKKGLIIKIVENGGNAADVVATTSTGSNGKYVSNSDGQRKGAIGHYVSRIVASLIVTGEVKKDTVLAVFGELFEGIDKKLS